jgi:hypothetical protein
MTEPLIGFLRQLKGSACDTCIARALGIDVAVSVLMTTDLEKQGRVAVEHGECATCRKRARVARRLPVDNARLSAHLNRIDRVPARGPAARRAGSGA